MSYLSARLEQQKAYSIQTQAKVTGNDRKCTTIIVLMKGLNKPKVKDTKAE